MDRDVYLVVNGEDYHLGRVSDVLDGKKVVAHTLMGVISDIVDTLVYDADFGDYTVCSVEIR